MAGRSLDDMEVSVALCQELRLYPELLPTLHDMGVRSLLVLRSLDQEKFERVLSAVSAAFPDQVGHLQVLQNIWTGVSQPHHLEPPGAASPLGVICDGAIEGAPTAPPSLLAPLPTNGHLAVEDGGAASSSWSSSSWREPLAQRGVAAQQRLEAARHESSDASDLSGRLAALCTAVEGGAPASDVLALVQGPEGALGMLRRLWEQPELPSALEKALMDVQEFVILLWCCFKVEEAIHALEEAAREVQDPELELLASRLDAVRADSSEADYSKRAAAIMDDLDKLLRKGVLQAPLLEKLVRTKQRVEELVGFGSDADSRLDQWRKKVDQALQAIGDVPASTDAGADDDQGLSSILLQVREGLEKSRDAPKAFSGDSLLGESLLKHPKVTMHEKIKEAQLSVQDVVVLLCSRKLDLRTLTAKSGIPDCLKHEITMAFDRDMEHASRLGNTKYQLFQKGFEPPSTQAPRRDRPTKARRSQSRHKGEPFEPGLVQRGPGSPEEPSLDDTPQEQEGAVIDVKPSVQDPYDPMYIENVPWQPRAQTSPADCRGVCESENPYTESTLPAEAAVAKEMNWGVTISPEPGVRPEWAQAEAFRQAAAIGGFSASPGTFGQDVSW